MRLIMPVAERVAEAVLSSLATTTLRWTHAPNTGSAATRVSQSIDTPSLESILLSRLTVKWPV